MTQCRVKAGPAWSFTDAPMSYFAVIEERGPLVHVEVFDVDENGARRVALFACRASADPVGLLEKFLGAVGESPPARATEL